MPMKPESKKQRIKRGAVRDCAGQVIQGVIDIGAKRVFRCTKGTGGDVRKIEQARGNPGA